MTTDEQTLLELDGEQRWIVVSPFAISWVKACEAVSRLFGVWPPTAEIVRVVRPDLVDGKVYVLDREAILATAELFAA